MMSKFIIISAFFLLPFVTFSAFAQFELSKYELPKDHILTFEIDEEDEHAREKKVKVKNVLLDFLLILLGITIFILLFGLMVCLIDRNQHAIPPPEDRDLLFRY